MKFLIDAQLPAALKQVFTSQGFDCIHTLDLELGNSTPDKIINSTSIAEQRILITKDSDFFDSFLIKKEPYKLILVKLGNTSKSELIQFFTERLSELIKKLESEDMVLLSKKDT
jgi:predicted nuclease of predicted toxin-antitoxin system